MSASDHLGQQFEVVQPHRAVRIGERTFPASATDDWSKTGGGATILTTGPTPMSSHGAMIPTENGSLTYVEHHVPGYAGPKFSVHEPMTQTGDARKSPFFRRVSVTDDPEGVHKMIDSIGQRKLERHQVENNRQIMKAYGGLGEGGKGWKQKEYDFGSR